MTEATETRLDHADTTAEIVAAYVSRNHVQPNELPGLIRSVHEALAGLGTAAPEQSSAEPLKPAVSVKKSVTEDYIISLEDGRKFKSMKRYLSGLGMTPADYRAKWGLPSDYPMVAPAYAAKRSELARSAGLGRKVPEAALEPEPASQPEPEQAAPEPAAKPKRARKVA